MTHEEALGLLAKKKLLPDNVAQARQNIVKLHKNPNGFTQEEIEDMAYQLGMKMGNNICLNLSAESLVKRGASVDEITAMLDNSFYCWGCIRRNKFATALQKEFIILRRKVS